MRNKSNQAFNWLLLLLIVINLEACTSFQLSSLKSSGSASTVVVVKNAEGGYIAFTPSCIKKTDGNRVTIKSGSTVAMGFGTTSSGKIASALIELMSKSNTGGFGMTQTKSSDESGELSGNISVASEDLEVEVADIVAKEDIK